MRRRYPAGENMADSGGDAVTRTDGNYPAVLRAACGTLDREADSPSREGGSGGAGGGK